MTPTLRNAALLALALLAGAATARPALAQTPPAAAPQTIRGRVVTDMGMVFVAIDDRRMYEVGNEPWRSHLRFAQREVVEVVGQVRPTGIPGHPMLGIVQVDLLRRDVRGRLTVPPGGGGATASLETAPPWKQQFALRASPEWAAVVARHAGQDVDLYVEVTRASAQGSDAQVRGLNVAGAGPVAMAGADVSIDVGGATLRLTNEPFRALLGAHAGEHASGRFRITTPGAAGGDAVALFVWGRAAAKADVFDRPTGDADDAFADVAAGSDVCVVGEVPGFLAVELRNGRDSGYVRRADLALAWPAPAPAPSPAPAPVASTSGLVGGLSGP